VTPPEIDPGTFHIVEQCLNHYRPIKYFWISKICDRKTVGHVFKKLVQIEGTTQKCFSQKVVFYRSSHFRR
jgi:hypothetical protein